MSVAQFINVSKKFGSKVVLDDISFDIEEGEILGILGPNGSGKTTAMKILSSMARPTSGNVVRPEKYRAIIEQPCFYNALSGRDNLLYLASATNSDKSQVDEIIRLLNMQPYIKKRAGKYSLGMKQKLGIGCALLGKPELLILDEPVNGLDPLAIIEIRELLLTLKNKYGVSIFISSHILHEMQEVCDRVLILKDGKIAGCCRINDADRDNADLEGLYRNNFGGHADV
ncbi:MAG: ATP-binding cassette domain-containing protein [Clostridia bacterium]|nr:ATP-binding cassette domain-containing protein [Clostridia bacterium]